MDGNGRLFVETKSKPDWQAQSLQVAGLFAGIGGIEKGLAAAGHESRLLCENDDHAKAVLESRFPGVELALDIRKLKQLPDVDLVAAGFPCQDLSPAGQTRGINGSKSGLVYEVFRLLRKRPPEWLLLENVPFMLSLQKGRALAEIVAELELLKYKWAYRVVDTRAFGLPQRRERVFLLASQTHDPRHVLFADDTPHVENGDEHDAFGFYWTEGNRGVGWAENAVPTLKGGSGLGIPSPPAIWLPGEGFVTPDIRDAERLQGFPADWTKSAERAGKRSKRWWLVGNAVSVPVSRWIGRRLANPGRFTIHEDASCRGPSRWPQSAWNVGEGRFSAPLSTYPRRYKTRGLRTFLRYPAKPLSHRAAKGFFERASNSTLRFEPGFLEELGHYVETVSEQARPAMHA